MLRYYKRPWDETRGDRYDGWGRSVWLFETDEVGNVLRHVELYDGGQRLRYDENRRDDSCGCLSEKPLDPSDFAAFEINATEFEPVWSSLGWTSAYLPVRLRCVDGRGPPVGESGWLRSAAPAVWFDSGCGTEVRRVLVDRGAGSLKVARPVPEGDRACC